MPKKKLLLYYQGYPRLSQTYMLDEATFLERTFTLKIASISWPIFVGSEDSLPYNFYRGPSEMEADMGDFVPDAIHGHFLTNASVLLRLAIKYNCNFTLKTHSFDVLGGIAREQVISANDPRCKLIMCFPTFKRILVSAGINSDKIVCTFPMIKISRYLADPDSPRGDDIMSGGAMLPKKNIEGFIRLAKLLRERYPSRRVRYYSVKEDPTYFCKLDKLNISEGSPVEFITVQPSRMKEEYLRHKFLIYGACTKLNTVGYPLMIAEAQANGVIVITLGLRNDIIDYVTDAGFICHNQDEVMQSIDSCDADSEATQLRRISARGVADRYNIEDNSEVDKLVEKLDS